MKLLKRTLLLLISGLAILIIANYPKLNIIAGYAAKNASSSVFVAQRNLDYTHAHDNNFSPINLASGQVDINNKWASSSVFGLLTRTAVHREGIGSALTITDADLTAPYLRPKRSKSNSDQPFPYGNGPAKDSVFSTIDYTQINKAIDAIYNDTDKTRAVLVVHKDHIIAERYLEGFDKNSKILGWSMTKSVLSTVYGILQSQGKINVQDPAPIAAWQNDDRKNISIHNLLQMNSGLEWDENYNEISDVTKMLFLERDMTQSQIRKPLVGAPNQTWNYASGTTNLLSGILRSQFETQQAYLDFWYTDFIDKIGMHSMLIETDLSGHYVGSSYAWATPRDWAKFGLLYLHKGQWNGTQIFDPSWVDYVTTPTPTSNDGYGAQFWLNAGKKFKDAPANMFYADGYQGQYVFVVPDKDLVIVRMGLGEFDENELLKQIITAIK